MATPDIVVIGASAGGVQTLSELVSRLPADFAASIFVVSHIPPYSPSALPSVLARSGNLPATFGVDGDAILPGQIYVAPPDHHMMVEFDKVRVVRGPKENRFRPSIDPLFRSAAYAFGPRVIGIILSGMLDDGTAGLWLIKDRGGIAIVQEPEEALCPAMPQSVLNHVDVDYRLSISEIAQTLIHLIGASSLYDTEPRPISRQSEMLEG